MKLQIPSQLLIVLFFVGAAFPEDMNWEEANGLLVKATELQTFAADQRPKYRLSVKLSFLHTNKGTLTGTYGRDYVAPELWADRLEVGDFRQERVRIQKQGWTKKSYDLPPLQVDHFFKALNTTTYQMAQSDVVNRLHNRKLEGEEVRCIEFRNAVGRNSVEGEICVNRSAGTVSYWRYGKREIWYSHYVPFAGRVRPSHFIVAEASVTSVEADVTYELANALSAESFSPLKDAEMSDICSNSRALIAKSNPEPLFPKTLSRAQFRGPVVLRVEVDETGHVVKEAVIESLHPILDTSALEAVQAWTFEPRLCDGKPVNAVTRLDVRFR